MRRFLRLSYTTKNCDPNGTQNFLECQWDAMVKHIAHTSHGDNLACEKDYVYELRNFQAEEFYSLNEEVAAAMAAATAALQGASSDNLDQYSAAAVGSKKIAIITNYIVCLVQ